MFTLVAEYVQAQEGTASSPGEVAAAGRKSPVRMTRREYKQLQQRVAEKRRSNIPRVVRRVREDEVPIDAEDVAYSPTTEEETVLEPDSLIGDGVASESGDGFLDVLTSDQVQALESLDAVIIVKRRKQGHQ
jgi:hypothetical protein